MRLFAYYAAHSFKNQLKKIFKSWVLIFVLVCVLGGGLLGAFFGRVGSILEEHANDENTAWEYDEAYDEEYFDEDEWEEEADFFIDRGDGTSVSIPAFVEAIAGLALLLILLLHLLGADKSGSAIFLPADVNLLFPSPRQPQSVLLFRLMANLGATVFASVYLIFQLPNLILNAGLTPFAAWMILASWLLALLAARLLQVFFYTLLSSRPGAKRHMRTVVLGAFLVIFAGYFFYYINVRTNRNFFGAAVNFLGGHLARFIPLWGWMKGMVGTAVEGKTLQVLGFLGLNVLGLVLLCLVIWRLRADFYEEAMARSEQTAALQEQVAADESGRLCVLRARDKDRSERIPRNQFHYGRGASVFFFKALYNRFRFARGRIFTKTMTTYLALALAYAVLLRFVFEQTSITPLALILAAFSFYRALGNPLAEDSGTDYFQMIPESMHAKLFYSLLGGSTNCFLDVFPPLLLAALVLSPGPTSVIAAFAWSVFIVTMDFFSTSAGTFILATTPKNAGKILKQLAQVLFLYFGLVPDVMILVLGYVFGHPSVAAMIASAVNLLLGLIFFAITPAFL